MSLNLTPEASDFWTRSATMREFEAPYLHAHRARIARSNEAFNQRALAEEAVLQLAREQALALARKARQNVRCDCGLVPPWKRRSQFEVTCKCGRLHTRSVRSPEVPVGNPCACGCGLDASPGRRFVLGHATKETEGVRFK